MTVVYRPEPTPSPHVCACPPPADHPLGTIWRCDGCRAFWLRKEVIADYWVAQWVPVCWYHRAARKRIKAWVRKKTNEDSMFAKLRDTFPGEGWVDGEKAWREADDTTPTRFRVTAKLYRSLFDDESYSEATWQGTRFQIGEMAGEYAESTDNPLLHMEIDTVEVLSDG